MLTIIGCGNVNRTDDGAGVAVIRQLTALLGSDATSGARLFDAGTDGMSVMFRARGATALVVIDACRSGGEPGAIYEVPGAELEGAPPLGLNLHEFRWQHALYSGRRIFRDDFPSKVAVYLIECQSLTLGIGLTPPVERATQTVARIIEQRIRAERART